MHEDTRRWLLRMVFLLTCVLPTLTIAAWGVGRSLPFATRGLERQLQVILGMSTQLGELVHTRPGAIQLTNLQFRHAETGEPILAVGQLDAEQMPAGWRVHVPQVKLKASELDTLWNVLHQRVLTSPELDSLVRELVCDEVLIPHGDAFMSLYRVHWKREETIAVHRSELSFSLEPRADAPQVHLLFSRIRDVQPVTTRVVLSTGEERLPGWLLQVCAGKPPTAEWTFQGDLAVEWRASAWEAELQGSLDGIDVMRACDGWMPHRIAGTAKFQFENMRFDQQGLLSARGAVEVTGLQVATAFLLSLGALPDKPIEFLPGKAPDRGSDVFAADRFAVDFWLNEHGLVCRASQQDAAGLPVAVSDASGPVLLCDGSVNMFHLVWALIPGSEAEDLQMAAKLQRSLPATAPRARRR